MVRTGPLQVGGLILQWGHGREAMDGLLPAAALALLGLLQWGHGREAMDGSPTGSGAAPSAWNFNGAMAVRPWMVAARAGLHPEVELQWGHGREAMDGSRYVPDDRIDLELQWGHGREAMDGS